MSDRIGQQLGNYWLVKLLGQGGFADVYLGEHLYLNTKAAIKVLQTRLSNEDMTDFQKEARTIANLVHPNIIRVLDFGVDNATPYLVMDYAPNGTLRQFFPKAIALAPQQILPYVKQIASALQYAHEHKIVHRDVKPENMLLSSRNTVLLSDFGIATVSQSSRFDGSGPVVGTASYMAPEQIQGKPVTASDQYALGIVLYEWLVGERPFRGTFTEVTSQQMFAVPTPLHQKVPTISPEIEEVVMIALAKDPQQRFASMEVFARAFEQAVQADQAYSSSISHPDSVGPYEPTVLARPVDAPPMVTPANVMTPPTRPVTNYGQTPVPPLYTPPVPQANQGISRRTFVLGMTGIAALVVAGGAFVLWETSHQSNGPGPVTQETPVATTTKQGPVQSTPTATQATTQPDPTSAPGPAIGTTFVVYHGHSGQVNADTWSPDGNHVATGGQDTTVQVWNALTGGNVVVYRGHTKWVWAVDWQPSGQLVASGSSDATVKVWNAQSATTNLSYVGHTNDVYAVAWSPDGTRIASGGSDNTVQVWNAATGQKIITYNGHSAAVHQVSWSPDGSHIVSVSEDKTAQVWDANTGITSVTYRGHTDKVLTVDWSHNGMYIVSGSWDATAQVWNASTGNHLLTYSGHSQRVWSVAWSPDDTKIVSGSHDGTVQIWSSSTGSTIYTYTGHGQGNTVWQALWSPNGKLIASAGYEGAARVWQAE
jgi:eukaryotic-like serine/threonine-protein kinase